MYEVIIFVIGFLFATTIIYFLIPSIVYEAMANISISIVTKQNDKDDMND